MKRIVRNALLITALVLLAAIIVICVVASSKSKKPTIESVSISGESEFYFDEFDPSKLKIQLNYSDGTSELVSLDEGTVSGDLEG